MCRLLSAFRDKFEKCTTDFDCTKQKDWYFHRQGKELVRKYRKLAINKFGAEFFSEKYVQVLEYYKQTFTPITFRLFQGRILELHFTFQKGLIINFPHGKFCKSLVYCVFNILWILQLGGSLYNMFYTLMLECLTNITGKLNLHLHGFSIYIHIIINLINSFEDLFIICVEAVILTTIIFYTTKK